MYISTEISIITELMNCKKICVHLSEGTMYSICQFMCSATMFLLSI